MASAGLTTLRDKIEDMDHIHQLRILEIVNKGNTDYTENSNGIFINMTTLSATIVKEITDYIEYVRLQQQQLDKIENDKESIKNTFYKDNKGSLTYNR